MRSACHNVSNDREFSSQPSATGITGMRAALTDFISNEWYYFGPLLLMSMTAMALIIWRLLLNNSAKTNLGVFLPVFQATLQKDGIEGARKFCSVQSGLIPRKLFVAGLDNAKQGASAMRKAMANTIELEILPEMNFLLAPMIAIGKIATMVGLFLTVVSMIGTFSAIGEAVKNNAQGRPGAQPAKTGPTPFATPIGLITPLPPALSPHNFT